ncbi:hypothetical protein [Thioflexithrix psekupsensis]|uniref:Uncharacterized protein n=1 Tax=Thioflexithrix psekupsensis TaxID=1570016 RepID=A0A251X460_9GAMM|nr:hypothetical protein [Thioflexithrix psekupsensis]OUD12283.1 hypothetical protein TPSD3_14290 [Thioflexithrix psekupsensis]
MDFISDQSRKEYPPRTVVLPTGQALALNHDPHFKAVVTEGLRPELVADLARGRIVALHAKNAFDPDWCDLVAERFTQHPATKKEGVIPPIYSLGSHLYSYPKEAGAAAYFSNIEHTNQAISDVLPNGHDPIVSFLQAACEWHDAEFEYLSLNGTSVRHGSFRLWGEGTPLSEEDAQCYFAAPHEDYAETNANNSSLPQIYQSNNVYIPKLCEI